MSTTTLLVLFGCWLVGAAGMAGMHLQTYRFLRGRPVAVRGWRIALDRLRRPLPDVAGRKGNFRGLVWQGTPDGLVCQSPESIAVGACRPDGDGTLYEARVPAALFLLHGGALGFFGVGGAVMFSGVTRFEWAVLVPPGLMLFTLGLAWLFVRRARKAAREMVWHLDGLLAELAEPREP